MCQASSSRSSQTLSVSDLKLSGATLTYTQLVVALGNFGLAIALVRTFEAQAYAWVSVCVILYTVLLNAQRVVVGEQLIVRTTRSRTLNAAGAGRASALLSGLVYTVAASACLGATQSFSSAFAIVPLGVAVLWYDACRYEVMCLGNVVRLLVADIIVAAIVWSYTIYTIITGTGSGWVLSGLALLYLGAPLIMFRFRSPASFRSLTQHFRASRSFTAWSLVQTIGINSVSQFSILLCLPFVSSQSFAGLRVMQALVGPFTTPAAAVQPALISALARRRRRAVPAGMGMQVSGGALLFFAVGSVVLVELLPEQVLAIVGGQYQHSLNLLYPIMCNLSMVYVGLVAGMQMRVHMLGASSAVAQAIAITIGLALVPSFSSAWGVEGAAWALVGQGVVSAGLAWAVVVRHSRDSRTEKMA